MSETAAQKRQYRVDHGLCPVCGNEAAPYYLCPTHREMRALGRLLDKMADRGVIQKERRSGKNFYLSPPGWKGADMADFRWHDTIYDMKPNDKRLRPRMGRRPIDLDETLIGIFREAGKPLDMDEILFAWGKLRSKRKQASLASDMTTIIAAQRKRKMRAAKRLAHADAPT